MSVRYATVGAATSTSLRIRAQITGTAATLIVARDRKLSDQISSQSAAVNSLGGVDFTVTGLEPDVPIYYGFVVDGVLDADYIRHTKPLPDGDTMTFATASCAGQGDGGISDGGTFWPNPLDANTGVSNAPVFSHIKAHLPDQFIHSGDWHYGNIAANDPSAYRALSDRVFSAPHQQGLYDSIPWAYVFDDHDMASNDGDRTDPSVIAANQVYRERQASYPLPGASGVYQTWTAGDGLIRFIMTDLRTFRDPDTDPDSASKTMLGTVQKQWFKDVLLAATEDVICWVNTVVWAQSYYAQQSWSSFATERQELADFFTANGLGGRMFIVSGDAHSMWFDDGSHNTWGGFPVYQCAPLDAHVSDGNRTPASHGSVNQRGAYGLITVERRGERTIVYATGYINDVAKLHHSFIVGPAVSHYQLGDGVVNAGGEQQAILNSYVQTKAAPRRVQASFAALDPADAPPP